MGLKRTFLKTGGSSDRAREMVLFKSPGKLAQSVLITIRLLWSNFPVVFLGKELKAIRMPKESHRMESAISWKTSRGIGWLRSRRGYDGHVAFSRNDICQSVYAKSWSAKSHLYAIFRMEYISKMLLQWLVSSIILRLKKKAAILFGRSQPETFSQG